MGQFTFNKFEPKHNQNISENEACITVYRLHLYEVKIVMHMTTTKSIKPKKQNETNVGEPTKSKQQPNPAISYTE